jgi:hypothetical protein
LPALSEYAAVAGRQHTVFRPPSDIGEAARWVFLGVAAWLVLKILLGALRLMTRR